MRLADDLMRGLRRLGRAGLARRAEPDTGEPPLRAELFGIIQLEGHARALAAAHELDPLPTPERLLHRLDENERIISRVHALLVEALGQKLSLAPAAEWFLDNYYIIEEQIELARLHLPSRYSRQLPRLKSGLPRVYELILDLVSHTDGRVDEENLTHFVRAYQEKAPLVLGELWALPIMLRLTLMESLRRVAHRIAWRRRLRDEALQWAVRFADVARRKPRYFVTVLSDFVRADPPIAPPFIAELTANLEGSNPSLGLVIAWLEQELSERGQTLELIQQAESNDQAADQASIANTITSLRRLAAIDWRDFVERLSAMEAILCGDPAGIYGKMDFATRDRYRHVVERLARRSARSEVDVARAVVGRAGRVESRDPEDIRLPHVGYYLTGDGRPAIEDELGLRKGWRQSGVRFLRRHAFPVYVAAVAGVLCSLAAPLAAGALDWFPRHPLRLIALLVLLLLVASRPAIALVNWLATRLVSPRGLPRMDFSEGIPAEHATAVVVPVLLSHPGQIRNMLDQLEIRFLANRSPHLSFGILSDFLDADREIGPADAALLELAVEGIRTLNAAHSADGPPVFFFLHRPRRWNPGERVWMGYERKRGKLHDFNCLVLTGDRSPFSVVEADLKRLRAVRYVITLDADTQMPPGSAQRMAGVLAHPLNRPRLHPRSGRVEAGYGILQPRLAVSLTGAGRSAYAALFAGEVGIDPYTREVSHVYQDLFGVAPFMGKGIYDVRAFHAALDGRFPENRILSHDLIEGGYARCGFLNDEELIEEQPSTYLADARRRHRWVRGDWQIARWLWPRVPCAGGRTAANPLPAVSRWMIFDNLRRSLVPAALVAALALGWFAAAGAQSLSWTASLLGVFFFPDLARAVCELLFKGSSVSLMGHLTGSAWREARAWGGSLLDLATMPFVAAMNLDAIGRVWWRLWISRRRLLQWVPAADVESRRRGGPLAEARVMAVAPLTGAGVLAAWLAGVLGGDPVTLPAMAAVWLAAPAVTWMLGRPTRPRHRPPTPEQARFVRGLARRTWAYFESLQGPEHNWLPPDNIQEMPRPVTALRTSPTNIGMALLSHLAAYDFGYLSRDRLIDRLSPCLDTLERMERYRGHFFNWYATDTLQPLAPRYISSVDSGNLIGSLITLRGGLAELLKEPLLHPRWRDGLRDTLSRLAESLREAERQAGGRRQADGLLDAAAAVEREAGRVAEAAPGLAGARASLAGCRTALEAIAPSGAVEGLMDGEVQFWLDCTRRQVEDFAAGVSAERTGQAAGGEGAGSLAESASGEGASTWEMGQVNRIRDLIQRVRELEQADFEFMYNPGRHLLSLGYNLDTHQVDPSDYDMLASEARLTSFIEVARGRLPVEHWFRTGRLLAPGGRVPVLLSWSGSMFEYLMPLLVMPSFEGTLLDESACGAVRRQIRYGAQRGVPWGISESGYNQVDAQMIYQYRAFGIPGLGLKRGLGDDLVVAPYATALALMVAPEDALHNLQELSRLGLVGRYGLYEAADFTPARVREGGGRFAIVRSHMAHHSGMGLLAFDHLLNGRPMQRRFLADPEIRSAELLLQERIPRARTRSSPGAAQSPGGPVSTENPEACTRSFQTAATPAPEVHLLSNGRYHAMVTNAGGGYSRWQNLALTRWREDGSCDPWGFFLYIRDVQTGRIWSATHQPVGGKADAYDVTYSQGIAEFRLTRERVACQTRLAVSPEDDLELRHFQLTNLSDRRRILELTSYFEVVLLPPEAEATHPVFSGLFVESEALPEKSSLLFVRRPRAAGEEWPVLFHMLVPRRGGTGEPSFETRREAFVGRARTPRRPRAMDESGPLENGTGAVLDPVGAIRHRVTLGPGESVELDSVLGVARTRADALTLIDKHLDLRLTERVFGMAWTHSQVLLHHVRASEAEAQLYARMAGPLIYANPRLRAGPSLIARNRRGQSSLWSHGISGDHPIVLLRMTEATNLAMVRQLVQAHSYWRRKGLKVDLVIWAEAYSGYRQNLLDAILGLVNAGPEAKTLDQPGGIFVRNVDQLPPEDRLLMQVAARLIVSDRYGPLPAQLDRPGRQEPVAHRLEPVRKPESVLAEERVVPERHLACFNGIGGFTEDGREYVSILRDGVVSPAPWANVLANAGGFGSVVTECGGGYTWDRNAHEFRLTPWCNDPVGDTSGEAFYIRDEETGRFWSPTFRPAPGHTPYVCRHGLGYSAHEHTQDRLFSELYTFVAVDAPVKCTTLTLRNLSPRSRRLSVTGYVEWVLGDRRETGAMHTVSRLDPQTGAILAWNNFRVDFGGRVGFFHCSGSNRSTTADRVEFIGRNGSLGAPEALRMRELSNSVGAGFDPCAAIQTFLDLQPGETRQVVFVLGAAGSEDEARPLIRRFSDVDGARQALEGVWQFWKHQLGGIYVETPDASLNYLANHWLLYQTLTARFWGRSGFYQSGGAYGFRDQLQDSLAFLYECPGFTRTHLLRCAGRQFPEGDVQHWWHPPGGRGVRTHIADDSAWLAYATARYVEVTGDTGVLDEEAPFIESRRPDPGEESVYDQARVSDRKATLYAHGLLGIRHALRMGSHGLPLMGGGDWNDGMNRVGHEGRGESVWMAFFLCDVLKRFAGLAALKKDEAVVDECGRAAAALAAALDEEAWDGEWYRRAFFDNGAMLGSAGNTECRIDLLPQSWAAMGGAADPDRARRAMQAAWDQLVDPRLNLIRLLTPAFDSAPQDPGYIKGYVPGIRENGGQYTHAALWFAIALAVQKDARRAWEAFRMLNPVGHADTPERLAVYKAEPYVVAADVYTAAGHEGRGGWTWYTGAAGWMYQLLLYHLLGLTLRIDRLSLRPLFHPDWKEFKVHYRYRRTFYHIRICRVGPETWNTRELWVDGVEQPEGDIHLVDDGREHAVEIQVG